MNRCRIVPAIDLIEGRCVRLRQGNFAEREEMGDDPVEIARGFAASGFTRLHLVDLDGARSGIPRHLGVLRRIVAETGLQIDVSGGLRTDDTVAEALESGASQVIVGSAAVERPEMVRGWITRFGADAVVVGVDVLNGEVRIKGWQEGSSRTVREVLERYADSGLRWVMSTDITRDGMLEGPSLEIYRTLGRDYPDISIIASGGVTSADDVRALAETGVREIIVGKAIYAETLDQSEVRDLIW
jgi:phosphoribosylformimino-5-aminoimidazole carboxamide ribotide isomerase